MELIRYVIIDDDSLAHSVILNLMGIHENYKCIAQHYNVKESIEPIRRLKPDFIFLDLDMPDFNGFELIKYIDKSIKVIITTSHRNYALDGFNNGVVDFLTKPISKQRLFESVIRVHDLISLERRGRADLNINNYSKHHKTEIIYVSRLKSKEQLKLTIDDITYITKSNNEAEIYTTNDGPFYKTGSLKEIIQLLPPDLFSFANQSFIFNTTVYGSETGEVVVYYDHHLKSERIIKVSPQNKKNFIKR